MERVCEFLQKAHVFYVATVEGNQPRVRPFGIAHIIDGKLCVMTGKKSPCQSRSRQIPRWRSALAWKPNGCVLRVSLLRMTPWKQDRKCWMLIPL